jgi:hypothetical protein
MNLTRANAGLVSLASAVFRLDSPVGTALFLPFMNRNARLPCKLYALRNLSEIVFSKVETHKCKVETYD